MSLFNRAEVIDNNFRRFVRSGKLPEARTKIHLDQVSESKADLISIFESQVCSRHMDIAARLLKDRAVVFTRLVVLVMRETQYLEEYFHTRT